MIRPSGFSPTRVMARQFALCRKCPRGFEGPVILLWKEIPVCQSCYIKELEAWNAKLNAMADTRDGITSIIHGQQMEALSKTSPKSADTSQETNSDSRARHQSRPGIHGPQDKDLSNNVGSPALPRSCSGGDRNKTVDAQCQDWLNRKAAEVKSPFSSKSPDNDDGGKE